MTDRTTISVKTDPDKAWTENRNGVVYISRVDVWSLGDETVIQFANKKGTTVRGCVVLGTGEFTELCAKWLEANRELVTNDRQ